MSQATVEAVNMYDIAYPNPDGIVASYLNGWPFLVTGCDWDMDDLAPREAEQEKFYRERSEYVESVLLRAGVDTHFVDERLQTLESSHVNEHTDGFGRAYYQSHTTFQELSAERPLLSHATLRYYDLSRQVHDELAALAAQGVFHDAPYKDRSSIFRSAIDTRLLEAGLVLPKPRVLSFIVPEEATLFFPNGYNVRQPFTDDGASHVLPTHEFTSVRADGTISHEQRTVGFGRLKSV